MQYYDINIAANGVRRIQVQGDYVYYLSGSAGGADPTIVLQAETGSEKILLKPGQAYRLATGQQNIGWTISNYANAATIAGVLLMGEGEFSDNRVSGSVEVVDGGKARTMAGSAFFSQIGMTSTGANYPRLQLWNPVGSGKNVILSGLHISSDKVTSIRGAMAAAMLANDAGGGISKKSAGALSSALLKYEETAAIITGINMSIQVAANVDLPLVFKEPIAILPGYGYTIGTTSAANGVTANFEYTEELQ